MAIIAPVGSSMNPDEGPAAPAAESTVDIAALNEMDVPAACSREGTRT